LRRLRRSRGSEGPYVHVALGLAPLVRLSCFWKRSCSRLGRLGGGSHRQGRRVHIPFRIRLAHCAGFALVGATIAQWHSRGASVRHLRVNLEARAWGRCVCLHRSVRDGNCNQTSHRRLLQSAALSREVPACASQHTSACRRRFRWCLLRNIQSAMTTSFSKRQSLYMYVQHAYSSSKQSCGRIHSKPSRTFSKGGVLGSGRVGHVHPLLLIRLARHRNEMSSTLLCRETRTAAQDSQSLLHTS
jgi:hypothetical protein